MLMYGLIHLIITALMIGSYLYSLHYKSKKQKEYKGDERWHLIQLKANQVAMHYSEFLMALCALISVIRVFKILNYSISLNDALLYLLLLIMLRSVVELVALKHFDRVY